MRDGSAVDAFYVNHRTVPLIAIEYSEHKKRPPKMRRSPTEGGGDC